MSRWFPAVDTPEGARHGVKSGTFGALLFAAMVCVGAAFLLIAGHMPKEAAPNAMTGALIGMLIELAFVLVCAWRFWSNRGLVIGVFTLALFIVEVSEKFRLGTTNLGWVIFYLLIITRLVNGLRGAWAFRKFRKAKPA